MDRSEEVFESGRVARALPFLEVEGGALVACRALARWPLADSALPEVSDDLAPWHRQRALDAEEVGNERGQLYHLTRLAALCPREPALHARLARIHARIAARLPAELARDREWQLGWAAARQCLGSAGTERLRPEAGR